jgi:hypothetical protein
MKINKQGVKRYLRGHLITYKMLSKLLNIEQSSMRKKIDGTRPLKDEEWAIIIRHYPSLRYYEIKERN